MDEKFTLICENAQNITLQAWPIIYGKNNPYDLDSTIVLSEFRDWAEEFEAWWSGHDQKWIDEHLYLEEIEKFTDRKVGERLRILNNI